MTWPLTDAQVIALALLAGFWAFCLAYCLWEVHEATVVDELKRWLR